MNMKRNMVSLIAALVSAAALAQTPQLPTGQPGKPQLPTPKIVALRPADLAVTGFQLISSEKMTTAKAVAAHIRVTIQNKGQIDAAPFKLMGAFQKSAQDAGWTEISEMTDFPAVKAGASVTKDCVFKILVSSIKGNSFNFRIKADVLNTVKESDENNNFSQGILIGL